MNRTKATLAALSTVVGASLGCSVSTVAVNATTSEVYLLKNDKLWVCTIAGDKLSCNKSYDVPR